MKYSLVFISILMAGCASPNKASSQTGLEEARMMDNALQAGRSSGICSAYEKLFTYAKSTGKKQDMDFAKAFFTQSATELGRTPQGFLDLCQDAFATSARMQAIIDKYK